MDSVLHCQAFKNLSRLECLTICTKDIAVIDSVHKSFVVEEVRFPQLATFKLLLKDSRIVYDQPTFNKLAAAFKCLPRKLRNIYLSVKVLRESDEVAIDFVALVGGQVCTETLVVRLFGMDLIGNDLRNQQVCDDIL